MYSEEIKKNVFKMYGAGKTVKEIAELTFISISTLYKWKKEYDSYKLVCFYIKNNEYDKAIKIAEKFPNSELIQNQLMIVYIRKGEYDKAIKIAEKFPNSELIQKQIKAVKKKINRDNMKNRNASTSKQNTVQNRKIDCYELNVIRAKLVANTISMKDIELLDKVREQIGDEIYSLVLAAIYERINLKDKAIRILTELNDSSNKKIRDMILHLKSKVKFYDIGKWDIIIGWPIDKKVDIKEDCSANSVPILRSGNVSADSRVKGCTNRTNNTSKKVIYSNNNSNGLVIVPKRKEKKTVSSRIKKTVYDVLDNSYKDLCFFVQKYLYVKMQDDSSRMEAIRLYDRLEELLCRDCSDEGSKEKVIDFLLKAGSLIASEIGCDDKISSVIERDSRLIRARKKDIN